MNKELCYFFPFKNRLLYSEGQLRIIEYVEQVGKGRNGYDCKSEDRSWKKKERVKARNNKVRTLLVIYDQKK